MNALLNPWLLLGMVALVVASGWQGHRYGVQACETRAALALAAAQSDAVRAAEMASTREAARLSAQAERDALARELEDQANADPVAGCGLAVDRVQRLNLR